MREIKFRAQDIANNKWVYGFFVCMRDTVRKPIDKRERITHRIYSGFADSCASEIGYDFFGDWTEVNPNTVGQFTGMYDKNGKEIYEGDVLQCGSLKGVITWHHDGYWCIHTSDSEIDEHSYRPLGEMIDYFRSNRLDYDIIGNIHDRKEADNDL